MGTQQQTMNEATEQMERRLALGGILRALEILDREELLAAATEAYQLIGQTPEPLSNWTEDQLRTYLGVVARDLCERRPADLRSLHDTIVSIEVAALQNK